MTKSKGIDPAVQALSAIQNAMMILSNRITARGGNLTEALVRLGKGETRYENSLNLIAGELAWVSGADKKAHEITAPLGGRIHTVQVNFDGAIHWVRAISQGFLSTRRDSPVVSIGDQYPPKKDARFAGRIITLVNFGKNLSEDGALTWGKVHKLVPADPRAIWALGRQVPQLHIELGLDELAVVSLQGCYLHDNVRHLPYGLWAGGTLRTADLKLASDVFSEFTNYFAFERDSSLA